MNWMNECISLLGEAANVLTADDSSESMQVEIKNEV